MGDDKEDATAMSAPEEPVIIDTMEERIEKALKLKEEGNELMNKNQYSRAVEKYSEAIELDPTNHIYYSNRCAAFSKLNKKEEALKDAEKCVELAPKWPKAFLRLGHCLLEMSHFEKAKEAVSTGIAICDETGQTEQKHGLQKIMQEVDTKLLKKLNSDFFAKLKGKWHCQIPVEMGGYEQELDFEDQRSVQVTIMDRVVKAKMKLDATKSPIWMDLALDAPQEQQQPETVLYICDIVGDELLLCSPTTGSETTRPTSFSGVTFVKMKKGALPDVDEDTKKEVSKLSHAAKINKYMEEAIPIFPENRRLMPMDTDDQRTQEEISLLNVKFQADNFKITKKYGSKVEEDVRDLLVGSKEAVDDTQARLVQRLKSKMQKAMLLPPDEEMSQFLERQKDYSGDILPEQEYKKAAAEKLQKGSATPAESSTPKVEPESSKSTDNKRDTVLLVSGIALGVAAAAIGAAIFFRQSRSTN